jgi:hypothetical protein
MGDGSLSTILGAASAVTFADVQGASNATLLDTYSGSLALKDSVLTDVHKVSSTLQSATWSTKGALPSALTQALQTALTTSLTDTTKTGVGSVGLAFSLQNGLADFLSAGETITVVYNVTVSGGHGGAVTQPMTFVITGTNAAPVVTSADVSGGDSFYASGWCSGGGAASVQGDINFTDVNVDDTHTASATLVAAIPSSGAVSSALLSALGTALKTSLNSGENCGAGGTSGDVTWSFSAPAALSSLAAGQAVLVEYSVQIADNHGGVTSQPITLLLNSGSSQPVIVAGVSSAQISEVTGATAATAVDTASGALGVVAGNECEGGAVSSKLAFVHWSGGAAIPAASLAALNSALTLTLAQSGGSEGGFGNDFSNFGSEGGQWNQYGQCGEFCGGSGEDGTSTVNWSFSAANKLFSFLTAGQTLTLAYEVTGKDDCGDSVTRLITITVNGANSFVAPTAGAVSETVNENAVLTVQAAALLSHASDTNPGSTLSLTSVGNAQHGTVSLANGVVTFTPTAGYTGAASYQYTVTDNYGQTATGTATVTVNPVYVAPTANNVAETVNENAVLTVQAATLLANASDPNVGGTLSLASVSNPVNGTVSLVNGVVTFTPTAGYFGAASYQYTVTDNYGQSATATANVTVTPLPIATTISETVKENASITLTAQTAVANSGIVEPNLSGAPTVTSVGNAVNGTVSLVNGSVVFTPTAGYHGPASYQYVVTDTYGQTATVTANVTVYAPPTANNVSETVNENATLTISAANLLTAAAAADVNTGGVVSLASVSNAVNGTVSLAGGVVTFTPTAGYYGPASYQYTVTDNFGQTATATANITVYAPPTAANVSETVNENGVLTVQASTLLSNVVDLNLNGVLSLTSVGAAQNGTVALNNGVVTFTPTTGYYGPASYQYTATDIFGQSATATVNITVYAPPTANNVAETTNENVPLTVSAASLLTAGAAADLNAGAVLNVTSVGHAVNGAVALTNGVVTFTPTTGYYGPASYQYTVTDNFGQSVTATANVTVYAPVTAANVSETTSENTPVSIAASTLLANAADPNAGALLSLTSVANNDGTGTVSLTNGVVTFTPTPGYHGPASYQYTVTDNFGQTTTATANITVYAPPTANNVSETVNENATLTISAASLLTAANAADVNAGAVLGLTAVGNAVNGAVSLVNGQVIFTPTAGYTGPASYQYTVTDNFGQTTTATANITVYAPPIVSNVAETTNENVALTVQAASLLTAANAADANAGAVLNLASVGNAVNGTVALANGVVTFTPNAGYYGPASYQYTVTDNFGQTATATANVTVYAPPTATNVAETTNENTAVTIAAATLLANAVDPNAGGVLSLTSVGNAVNGTVSLANGVVTFTPTTGYYGPASYTYTVTDNFGQTATATANIAVNVAAMPPTLQLVNVVGPENTPIPISISTAVTDPADHISALVVSGLPVGSVLSDGHGDTFTAVPGLTSVDISSWNLSSLTFSPVTYFSGQVPLTVTSSADIGTAAPASTVGTFTVTVTAPPLAVNDTATVNEGTPKTINVLFNDIDASGLPLSVISVTNPAHGSIVVNANNTITYTPNAGYLGPDSFTYTDSDGYSGTSTATVNINVVTPSPAVAPKLGVGQPGTEPNQVGSIIPNDGSAINTVLTLHAGDVVSFNWNFFGGDALPYNDFAFVAVNGTEFFLSDVQAVGTKGVSGEHTFTYTVTADGSYNFGIGVMDVQSNRNASYLEVDNLAVNGATVQNFANGTTSTGDFAGVNGVTTSYMGSVVETTAGTPRFPGSTSLLPANGTHEAFLTSSPTVSENGIESFVGLAANQLQFIVASIGAEYTPIALPLSVTVPSNFPDDTYVTISGAPVGTVFNHGTYNAANNTWQIDAADVGGDLTFVTPASYSGSFNLSITATSVNYATNTSATTPVQTQFVTVNPAPVTLDGSAGNQVLVGGVAAGNTLIGGPGDTLTGGSTYDPTNNIYPSDTFVFNGTAFGKNTVTDFDTNSDVLQFSHTVFADANTALAHASQVGSDVVITFDANDMVTLKNVLLANLSASDFHII